MKLSALQQSVSHNISQFINTVCKLLDGRALRGQCERRKQAPPQIMAAVGAEASRGDKSHLCHALLARQCGMHL